MQIDDGHGAKRSGWRISLYVIIAFVVIVLIVVSLGVIRRHSRATTITAESAALPIGSSTHAITVGGLQRSYIVYRPATLPASAPLVVMIHGGYGSAANAEKAYGWDSEADRDHFLVAYPNSVGVAWNAGGGCCGQAATKNIDDVGFITAMVQQISREADVDQTRIYATGISNGGILDYALACRTDLFAAIGPDSATQLGPCAQPTPVSVIHIHGTADTRIPYAGGEGDGTAHIDGPAIPSLNATWRGIDQCAPPKISISGVVTTSVADCTAGRTVELITVAGAGHQWPGAEAKPVQEKLLHTDPPSTALNATDTIWQFFAQHHK